jgi:hypothetical protein
VSRFLPAGAILVLVTALLAPFGSTRWSWLAGPVASVAVWALDRAARDPDERSPARVRSARAAGIATKPDLD